MSTGLALFTLIHVIISLIGIGAGFFVMGAWLSGRHLPKSTAIFLWFTMLTSVTGLFLPFSSITPPVIFAVLSLIVIVPAFLALYRHKLSGRARTVFVVSGALSLYLNTFVLVAQLFLRVPALKVLAPTQAEPSFGATQFVLLVAFVVLTRRSLKTFRTAALQETF